MLTRGHYYADQTAQGEAMVLFVRRHWFSFFSWGILVFFMVLAPIIVFGVSLSQVNILALSQTARTAIITGTSAYYLFVLAVFLAAWIDYYLDVTIVTEQRLVDIHQNGLFNHRISEQSLLRVQDVSVRVRGPFQTMFQFGTVYVETAGEAQNFIMNNLPKPNQVANTIIELHKRLTDQSFAKADDIGTQRPVQKIPPSE